jgi:DNA-binding PadR family transcriptional regulator
MPDQAPRRLTGFEQVLLGVIADQPRSGYGLKKLFGSSPASVYQPSPGALYPALRRLEDRGLLRAERTVSSGGRAQRVYTVTAAGRAEHLAWLREPVVPATVAADLQQHLMRFSHMESQLPRAEVIGFLEDLAAALSGFVTSIEQLRATAQGPGGQHGPLALDHGIAVYRASLEWTESAIAVLSEEPGTTQEGGARPAGG